MKCVALVAMVVAGAANADGPVYIGCYEDCGGVVGGCAAGNRDLPVQYCSNGTGASSGNCNPDSRVPDSARTWAADKGKDANAHASALSFTPRLAKEGASPRETGCYAGGRRDSRGFSLLFFPAACSGSCAVTGCIGGRRSYFREFDKIPMMMWTRYQLPFLSHRKPKANSRRGYQGTRRRSASFLARLQRSIRAHLL
jgi:hypothetical protein